MPYHSLGSWRRDVRKRLGAREDSNDKPSGRAGDRVPVDRKCRLPADCPSSDGSGLKQPSQLPVPRTKQGVITEDIPRLPQVSPFWGSSFRMFCRYSMALGNCSRVRRIWEMAVMAGIDHWLCRSACSYACMAPSRSPMSSVRLPVRRGQHRQLQKYG